MHASQPFLRDVTDIGRQRPGDVVLISPWTVHGA
jgi:hypothetical protein